MEQQEVVASSVDGGHDGMDPSETLAIRSVASVGKSDLAKILASLTAATSTGGAEKRKISFRVMKKTVTSQRPAYRPGM